MRNRMWHSQPGQRRLLAFVLAAVATCAAPLPVHGTERPNVILVFIDDMGWSDFSCFGNRHATTPAFDRMAAEGIAFEQFYVNSPICSPSRVAISTGTYPQRWSITSYLAHREQNSRRGMAQWLDPAAPMLARTLQQNGYATGHFGKWHMGGQRDVTDAPPVTAYGFDTSLTNFEGLGPKLLPLTMKPDGKVGRIWAKADILGGPVTWMQRSEITTGFIDAAMAFMRDSLSRQQPFYVNIWPDDVHSPFWPPVSRWGDGSKRRLYLSVLESMDAQFQRLFQFVRSDPQLQQNTLILICSDNGPEQGAGEAGSFKGFKTHLYEGGIRSPLIVWGPGFVAPAAVGTRNTDSVLAAIDLVPSLLALTQSRRGPETLCDGEDLQDTLLGHSHESRRQPLYFSRPPDRKHYYGFRDLPDLAVRDGQWKLLCDYDGGRPELYNLAQDPGETTNLAASHPTTTRRLTHQLTEWHQEAASRR